MNDREQQIVQANAAADQFFSACEEYARGSLQRIGIIKTKADLRQWSRYMAHSMATSAHEAHADELDYVFKKVIKDRGEDTQALCVAAAMEQVRVAIRALVKTLLPESEQEKYHVVLGALLCHAVQYRATRFVLRIQQHPEA